MILLSAKAQVGSDLYREEQVGRHQLNHFKGAVFVCGQARHTSNSGLSCSHVPFASLLPACRSAHQVADADGFVAYLLRKLSPPSLKDKQIASRLKVEHRRPVSASLCSIALLMPASPLTRLVAGRQSWSYNFQECRNRRATRC